MLLADLMRFVGLLFVSRNKPLAENLFLRRQLALYRERNCKPRRPDRVTRFMLGVVAIFFD